MRIAVLGAGFTGLTCAYRLCQKGHQVFVFEKESQPGGLASGFKLAGWDWPLEKSYHHFFSNDGIAFDLIKELGLSDKLFFKEPLTAVYYRNSIKPLDTPLNLLQFSHLSLLDRLRTGLVLAYLKALCKAWPFWQRLEAQTAEKFLTKTMGQASYQVIWEPLLKSKFGKYSSSILASWFWARIKKRSKKLGYLEGGFQILADKLVEKIKELGGKIEFSSQVKGLSFKTGGWIVKITHNPPASTRRLRRGGQPTTHNQFDIIVSSLPTPEFLKIFSLKSFTHRSFSEGGPNSLNSLISLSSLPHLTTQILILELKAAFFPKTLPVYWLNINDTSFPFLSLVEHTNFVDKKYYGGRHLLYIGNYLPPDHPYLQKSEEELLRLFAPYLKKINPSFSCQLSAVSCQLFTLPFSQPIVNKNHLSVIKPIIQACFRLSPGLYFANQDLIYPWDRGVNYAIELGEKVAKALEV